MPITRRERKPRWRCRACGSTRIELIVEAYVVGPVDHDSDFLRVARYEHVEDHESPPLHLHCLNCLSEEPPRREGASTEVVLHV